MCFYYADITLFSLRSFLGYNKILFPSGNRVPAYLEMVRKLYIITLLLLLIFQYLNNGLLIIATMLLIKLISLSIYRLKDQLIEPNNIY